jgi:hypothetical protein
LPRSLGKGNAKTFPHPAVQLLHPVDKLIEAQRAVVVLVHRAEEGLQIGQLGLLVARRLRALRAGGGPIHRFWPRPRGVRAATQPCGSKEAVELTWPFRPCRRHRRRPGLERLFQLVTGKLLVPVLVGLLEPRFEPLRHPRRDFVGRNDSVVVLVEPVEEHLGVSPIRLLGLVGPCPER